jgi:hypothetical protein
MAITLELYELKNLCRDMAELGAAQYARMVSPSKDSLSQRAAFHEFGEARVKGWLRRGLVSVARSGKSSNSRLIYSRAELLAIAKSENFNLSLNK